MIDCNECKTEKRHECANMGKVKWLKLWWQLYCTSLPVRDLENFRPMDFCWTECTTLLLLDGFWWNWILEYFSKICQENSGSIKIGQEWQVLHMKTNMHIWSYLAQFFWEWEMFQTYIVEKIKTHVLCSVTFLFFLNCAIYEIMWKNVEWGRLQMTIWSMHISCWIPKATNTHSWNV